MLPYGDGSPSAPILIVGEAWGEEEERKGRPFVGRSGEELGRMLNEAGIMRSDCYLTNVVNARPPGNDLRRWMPETKKDITQDMVEWRGLWVKPILREGALQLEKEIELVKPRLIITLGNTSLFALCSRTGITKWRGSLLEYRGVRVVPTYHPAAVLRMWEWRAIAIHDLARAARELESPTPIPNYRFQIRPTFLQVLTVLNQLYNRALFQDEGLILDFDIETVKGHIRCFAFSWSPTNALCVPLMQDGTPAPYWTPEQEGMILWLFYKLTTHRNCAVRGQNLLYDFQYTLKHWHFVPNLHQDTMISHHVLWSGMPKSLLFQASLYCEWFQNWKDMVRHNEEKEGA